MKKFEIYIQPFRSNMISYASKDAFGFRNFIFLFEEDLEHASNKAIGVIAQVEMNSFFNQNLKCS